jgi:hypothetical protein
VIAERHNVHLQTEEKLEHIDRLGSGFVRVCELRWGICMKIPEIQHVGEIEVTERQWTFSNISVVLEQACTYVPPNAREFLLFLGYAIEHIMVVFKNKFVVFKNTETGYGDMV